MCASHLRRAAPGHFNEERLFGSTLPRLPQHERQGRAFQRTAEPDVKSRSTKRVRKRAFTRGIYESDRTELPVKRWLDWI